MSKHNYEVHPTAALFPFMGKKDFAQLKADIKTFGQTEPILKKGNVLIDGRNRLAVCEELEIDPIFVEFEGDDSAIPPLILSLNLHRRHLTDDQRIVIVAATRAPELHKEAAASKSGKGRKKKAQADGDLFGDESAKPKAGSATKKLAAEAQTTEHKARQADAVATHAPDLVADVVAGKEKLATAAKVAKARAKAAKPPKPTKQPPTLLEQVGKALGKLMDKFPISAHREVKEIIKTLIGGKNSEIAVATALQKELAKIAPKPEPGPSAKEIAAQGKKDAAEKHKAAKAKEKEEKASAKAKAKADKSAPAKGEKPTASDSESIFG